MTNVVIILKNFWVRRFISNFNFLSFNLIINFIQTSLLILLIGIKEYGVYQFVLTFILLSEVVKSLDSVVERLHDSKKKSSSIILNSIIYNKILFYSLFIPIIYFVITKLNLNSEILDSKILFLILIFFTVESFSLTFNYILISIGKLKILNFIIITKNIILVVVLIILYFLNPKVKIIFNIFIYTNLLLSIICLFFLMLFSEIKFKISKKNFKYKVLKFIYNKKFKRISIPILFTVISGYFKNYFVSIFFGIRGEFENVTITRLIIQISAAMHKILVGSINRFLPEIKNDYKNINISKIIRYNYFFIYISIIPYSFVFLFICFYFKYFLNYKLSNEIFLFITLIGIGYNIASHAQKYVMILKLELKYFFGYFTSPANFIILPLAIYYLGDKYNILGIGISYIISNIFMHLVLMSFYILATNNYKSIINLLHSLIALFVYFIFCNSIKNLFL